MAFEVNQVWNKINELTFNAYREPIPGVGWVNCGDWLSNFDVHKLLNGYTKTNPVAINMFTVQEISAVHAKARNQFKKSKLRWRISGGTRRNLGWIPFRVGAVNFKNGQLIYAKHHFKIWDSFGLSKYKFLSGNFAEDARGRWYFNVCVEVEAQPNQATKSVGIDLGLKATATCSDGVKLEAERFYRKLEAKLASAQRAHKKSRVQALHAKIKNQRKDALHKFTTTLCNEYGAIFVGDVSSTKLAKTTMSKSVYDAGWGILKSMLKYKAIARSAWFSEENEAYATQLSSCCGIFSQNRPRGRTGLGIREWTCECGVIHDRDVNAARNILALGHKRLEGGITGLSVR